jgi:protein required for attachment to host cells
VAHLHDRDLMSDRPGRSYESFGGARHALEREDDPRHREAVRFARRVARRLDEARRKDEFENLVVVAGPPFLGLLRAAMSQPTKACIAREIRKDLVHGPIAVLREHLAGSAG